MSNHKEAPAFPEVRIRSGDNYNPSIKIYYPGMTLRDYFAAKAMQAFLSNNELLKESVTCYRDSLSSEEAVAQLAYDQADFMLKERSK